MAEDFDEELIREFKDLGHDKSSMQMPEPKEVNKAACGDKINK